jgi:hypothetical protein
MKPETARILSDPDLVKIRTRWFERLTRLFKGEPDEMALVLCGISRYTEVDISDWQGWLDAALDALAGEAGRMADVGVFRPLVLSYNPRGVHFTDHLFGTDVFQMEDGTWQTRPLQSPVGQLQYPNLAANRQWQVMQAVAHGFVNRRVNGVIFAMPTIASVLNVAINLYGQEILTAMIDHPDAARHDLRVINRLLCDLHRWYRANIPMDQLQCIVPDGRCQPPGYGQLCGCSTQLLSPRQYRDFIAPLDEALLSVYPHGGMIHLCGAHTQHIPAWREMKALRAVQVNDRAAEDLPRYFNDLRSDQVLYVNPCEGMPLERIMQITGGRRLVLAADIKDPLPVCDDCVPTGGWNAC